VDFVARISGEFLRRAGLDFGTGALRHRYLRYFMYTIDALLTPR